MIDWLCDGSDTAQVWLSSLFLLFFYVPLFSPSLSVFLRQTQPRKSPGVCVQSVRAIWPCRLSWLCWCFRAEMLLGLRFLSVCVCVEVSGVSFLSRCVWWGSCRQRECDGVNNLFPYSALLALFQQSYLYCISASLSTYRGRDWHKHSDWEVTSMNTAFCWAEQRYTCLA